MGELEIEIQEQLSTKVKFRRQWAMPSRHTFTILPIRQLIAKYIKDGRNWVDPFAGENSPAEFTNDLNPNKPTKFHLPAKQFAQSLNGQKLYCLTLHIIFLS